MPVKILFDRHVTMNCSDRLSLESESESEKWGKREVRKGNN